MVYAILLLGLLMFLALSGRAGDPYVKEDSFTFLVFIAFILMVLAFSL